MNNLSIECKPRPILNIISSYSNLSSPWRTQSERGPPELNTEASSMAEKKDKRSWCAARSILTFCKSDIQRRSVFCSTHG